MAHAAEKSEADFQFDKTKDDVACVGALLKVSILLPGSPIHSHFSSII